MPAIFDTTDDGLKRITGILPANTQYVTTMFWVYFNAWPSSGQVRTFYMVSNSASRDVESIAIIQDDTGSIKLKIGTTLYGGQVFYPGWHSVGLRRRATLDFLDMDIDNDTTSVSNATIVFNTWTFDEVYLGHDPRIPTGGVSHQVAYFREWAAFLSYPTEWASLSPVQTTGLDTDTPLLDDLLDNTDNDHDWIVVGSVTFTGGPTSNVGCMGGWWFFSAGSIGGLTDVHHEGILQVYGGGTRLGDNMARLIAGVRVYLTSIHELGDIVTELHHAVTLRYGTGPNAADEALLTVADPLPADFVPFSNVSVPARNTICTKRRFVLVWKCSTYDSATSTYAADGYAKVYLNDALILNAVDVTIPRRSDGYGIEYRIGMRGDCDRMWARTVVDIPPTDSEGAFTSGTPSSLVYFDDFDGGLYPNWTEKEMYAPGGGASGTPNTFSDCGGDNGYGLSIYNVGPSVAAFSSTAPWAGLYRFERFPPIDLTEDEDPEDPPPPDEPIPGDPTGLYQLTPPTPGVTTPTHDTYIDRTEVPPASIERKIPDPTIRTALFGE